MQRRRRRSDEEIGAKRRRVPGGDGQDVGPDLMQRVANVGLNTENISVETLLEALSAELIEKLEAYESDVINVLSNCVAYKPERLTVFSTLSGLLNQKNNAFGDSLLSRFVADLKHRLDTQEYNIVVRILTFLGDLCNSHVLTPSSVAEFFHSIVSAASSCNLVKLLSDFYVYAVMHSLPWCGAALAEKSEETLREIMMMIDSYVSQRPKTHMKILGVWESSDGLEQVDYLDSLWAQIKKLRDDSWLENHIKRYYVGFDNVLSEAFPHNLPGIDFPTFDPQNSRYPLPRVVFRLFDLTEYSKNESAQLGPNSVERFLVEEDINAIIDNNHLNFRVCAKELLNYHNKANIPLNHVVVEVVFSQLFRLPRPPHLELFYASLLLELCRAIGSDMPEVLAESVKLLFKRVGSLQVTCLDRFVDWFSYHLSNFQYIWCWDEWSDVINYAPFDRRQVFVREVIEKCLRLAYYEKLESFVPEPLTPLIPPPTTIRYNMDDADHPAHEKAALFERSIRNRNTAEDILLELQTDRLAAGDAVQYSEGSVTTFTAVVLNMASKTFSHTFAAFTKFVEMFRRVCHNNRKMQVVLLATVYDCWMNHKQMLTLLVDKLMKMRIIEPISVVGWTLCDELSEEQNRTWLWELMNTALFRLYCQIQVLQRDIANLKVQKARQEKFQQVDESGEFEDVSGAIEEQQRELVELEQGLTHALVSSGQQFIDILTALSTELSENAMDEETNSAGCRFLFTLSRFKQYFLNNVEPLWERREVIHEKLFAKPDLDSRIVEVYDQFSSLKFS